MCTPFQIDGNFGGIAGIAEMLIQSHLSDIHLLAALPDAWKEGTVSGLKARGGFEVDIRWKAHRLTTARVKLLHGERCTIRTARPIMVKGIKAESKAATIGYLTSFPTQKDKVYELVGQ